jgi:hypothetical protein
MNFPVWYLGYSISGSSHENHSEVKLLKTILLTFLRQRMKQNSLRLIGKNASAIKMRHLLVYLPKIK